MLDQCTRLRGKVMVVNLPCVDERQMLLALGSSRIERDVVWWLVVVVSRCAIPKKSKRLCFLNTPPSSMYGVLCEKREGCEDWRCDRLEPSSSAVDALFLFSYFTLRLFCPFTVLSTCCTVSVVPSPVFALLHRLDPLPSSFPPRCGGSSCPGPAARACCALHFTLCRPKGLHSSLSPHIQYTTHSSDIHQIPTRN